MARRQLSKLGFMANDFLQQIVSHKKSLLVEKKAFFASLKKKLEKDRMTRYRLFRNAIAKPGQINLIGEIKKASPSKGLICASFDPLKIAKIYKAQNAAALSILTEEKFFLGKPAYIKTVSEQIDLPILTKDFIIDEVQIYEAFAMGASAVLLIMAILNDTQAKELMEVANHLDMDALIEVHDEKELNLALKLGADIIGINNRNLHTFEVNLDVSRKLIPLIPKDKVIVVESGLQTFNEVQLFKNLGAHAVLIGETFLKSPDIGAKVKEVMHGQG